MSDENKDKKKEEKPLEVPKCSQCGMVLTRCTCQNNNLKK